MSIAGGYPNTRFEISEKGGIDNGQIDGARVNRFHKTNELTVELLVG